MRTNRLLGIAFSCLAAIAAVGCSSPKTATNGEVAVNQQQLVVDTGFKDPTDYCKTGQQCAGQWGSADLALSSDDKYAWTQTSQSSQLFSGFLSESDVKDIPDAATIDKISVQMEVHKTGANNCSRELAPTLSFGNTGVYPLGWQSMEAAKFDTDSTILFETSSAMPAIFLKNTLGVTVAFAKGIRRYCDGLQIGSFCLGTWRDACADSGVALDSIQVKVNYHKCDDGTFWDGATCASCAANCATCIGAAANQCITCRDTDYLSLNEDKKTGTCTTCTERTCSADQYLKACEATADSECVACPNCTMPNTYVSACSTPTTPVCTTLTDCKAGQYVTKLPGLRSDRECGACGDGTYSTTKNARACTSCLPGWSSDNDGSGVGPTSCYPIPRASNMSPTSGVTDGGDTVMITGQDFEPTAQVLFDSTPATSVVVSANGTVITLKTPAHAAGDAVVTIKNAGKAAQVSLKQTFEYTGPKTPVVLSSITPNSGSIAGGTKVVIAGSGFVAGYTNVQFDGLPGTSVSVTAPNSLTVVTPAHAKGAVSVVVINGRGGMGTLTNGFTYSDSLPPAEVDGGVTTVTGSATATGTSATVTSSATATGTSATGTATTTSVVATATNTGSATVTSATATNTATKTATSVVVTSTVTGTATTSTRTNTATSVITTSVVTGSATTVDAGTDAAADGGSDAVIKTDGGVDAPAVDTKPVVDGGVDTAADAGVLTDGSVPPVDAIVPGVDAAPIGVDAKPVVVDAAADAATVVKKSDSGCDCRMGSSNAGQNGGVILLVLGSVLVAIRRKRNRR